MKPESSEFWSQDTEGLILLNPKLDRAIEEGVCKELEGYVRENHIYLMTSGSTETKKSRFKVIELAKDSILLSAREVNSHIASDSSDKWLLSLPTYHIGGLSILARCYLSRANYFQSAEKWDPRDFADQVESQKITLCSLVPTQLFDLVDAKIEAPDSLRAVFLGGGRASDSVRERAVALNWPILETYGMTEMGSQVATAPILQAGSFSQGLAVLPHIDLKFSKDRKIVLRSKSLMSRIFQIDLGSDVRIEDYGKGTWYESEDRGFLTKDSHLKVLGRDHRQVKVLGELVNLDQVESHFSSIVSTEKTAVLALDDERRGSILVLVTEVDLKKEDLLEKNNKLTGFQRLAGFLRLQALPRTALGKIKKAELEGIAKDQVDLIEFF